MEFNLKKILVEATDLQDLWFQSLYKVITEGRSFLIDEGSYAGQHRIEFDYFTGHVKCPGLYPRIPKIPDGLNVPAPVEINYVYGGEGYDRSYVEYLMSDRKEPGESYTYGERIVSAKIPEEMMMFREGPDFDEKIMQKFLVNHASNRKSIFSKPSDSYPKQIIGQADFFLNQMEWIINKYRTSGHRNNQLVIQVAQPSDLLLVDPPCLRSIDTRIQDGFLHFVVYFRSWDLWGGMPANLAAIQEMKEYMAGEIGVQDGEMIVESKGLHIYGYAEKFAKIRCYMEDNQAGV